MLTAPLDDSSGVSVHNAISPARAEADICFIVLVLVNDLVRVGLTGITAGVVLLAFAVPATANLDEVISPSRFVDFLLLTPCLIGKKVFCLCFHLVLPLWMS